MIDQLFRWVKASERMPDKTGRTICLRLGEPIVAYAVLRSDGEMRFETPASTVWKGYKDFEWLEPYTPSPVFGSLEPLEVLNKHKLISHRYKGDPYVNAHVDLVIEAMKEFAGYSKGGEDGKTLGQLIKGRTKENVLVAHISDEVWNELTSDSIWTNCIPIRMFQNILSRLEIPFWMAKEAMYKTYEILWAAKQKEKVTLDTRKDLWENREAFDKYVNRLGELIAESSRPSLDVDKVVGELKEANPFINRDTDIVEAHESYGYYTAVHKLQELLNQSK